MDSATWCRTPASASAARRLRPEVSKNSSTALSSNEGELERSTTTCVPARACARPSPVMVFTPVLGAAAMTSWPPWRRMAAVFEPIRPVPPMMTVLMAHLALPMRCRAPRLVPLRRSFGVSPGARPCAQRVADHSLEARNVGIVTGPRRRDDPAVVGVHADVELAPQALERQEGPWQDAL